MRFTRWDQGLSTGASQEVLQGLALWHCSQVEGDGGVILGGLIYDQDIAGILAYPLDYAVLSVHDALHLRQALAFYTKRVDLEVPGVRKEDVALGKFLQAEELCRQTNDIFRNRRLGLFQYSPRTERVLFHAARKIAAILGDTPSLADLELRFGPGATTQVARRKASYRAKLGETPACSSELFPAAHAVLKLMPEWCRVFDSEYTPTSGQRVPLVIHEGRVVFVPKSAKEFRTVVVEPSLNTMCQAGIGRYMAGLLRSQGVNIRDQTLNQRLAREGSRSGALATLDLSSASDTVATGLVCDLLGGNRPPGDKGDWYSFLSRFRTGHAVLPDGQSVTLEKFSSMGNGFTFPLETLIFYALAYGNNVEDGNRDGVCVAYGDDIIVPAASAVSLMRVLTDVGFVPNASKSYWSGPFRESCGKDYLSGFDIRPVYQKDRLFCYDLFRLHNHYVAMHMAEPISYILDFVDPSIRIYGPAGYGDGHLVGNWEPVRKSSHIKRGYGGSIFDTYSFRDQTSKRLSRGDRALPCYTIYLSPEGPGEPTEWESNRTQGNRSRVVYDRDGNLSVTVPGKGSYYRISIYTLGS